MEGYIYLVTNILNGKKYVGKTSSTPEQRFKEHVRDSYKDNKRYNSAFHKAIRLYGPDYFNVITLEKCDIKSLDSRETYWIKYYNTYKDGYNSTLGGEGAIIYDIPSKEELIRAIKSSKNVEDLRKKFGVYKYTLNNWLAHYSIDLDNFSNIKKRRKVEVGCIIDNSEFEFESLSSAGIFCMENKLTDCKNPGRIGYNIKRAIERKGTYLGIYWYYI